MNLLLKNLCWHNGMEKIAGDVRIENGIIAEIGINLHPKKSELVGNFKDSFLYPGLINGHDHLEMNLYPKLGTPPYLNYVEWAKDIYHPTQSPLREIENLKIETRLLWGGLKNLIAGATTVIHHNPWHRSLANKNFPVKVLKIAWAHSLAFGKNISKSFPRQQNIPFVIHAAEGIDPFAFSEISKLQDLNLLKKNTVLVHAVGLDNESIETLLRHQVSMVWCPASNLFMFDRTAPVHTLKNKIAVSLGTDSTLTGSPTLLDELEAAGKTKSVSSREIFEMVTLLPARIFNLPSPLIAVGQPADLFVTPIKKDDYFENLLKIKPANISLVMSNGLPRLKDIESADKWPTMKNKVSIHGVFKYCDIEVAALKAKIEKKVPSEILEKNPLWKLIEI